VALKRADLRESTQPPGRLRIALANEIDRDIIYRLRHDVFAAELAQHPINPQLRLTDSLDEFNTYIIASISSEIAGFISITPPGSSYSIDKYVSRDDLPFRVDARLYELRLLAVMPAHRRSEILPALIYGAFRWVEAQGGDRIMAIGRREILDIYLKVGMRSLGREVKSGAVTFELISATTAEVSDQLVRYAPLLARLKSKVDWCLGIPFDLAKV